MCIIIHQKPGQTIPTDHLRQSIANNPDGAGIMYHTEGLKLVVIKPIWAEEELIGRYKKIRKKNPMATIIVHCRIGTSGQLNTLNTHPHRIDKNLAFVHNGVFQKLGDKVKSDTVELCDILKEYPKGWVYNRKLRKPIEFMFTESHSKGVFLDNKGSVWIVNESAGIWQDGIWYSNSTYKKIIWTPGKYHLGAYGHYSSRSGSEEGSFGNLLECYGCGNYFYPDELTLDINNDAYCQDCCNDYVLDFPPEGGFCDNLDHDICSLCEKGFDLTDLVWDEEENPYCQECWKELEAEQAMSKIEVVTEKEKE